MEGDPQSLVFGDSGTSAGAAQVFAPPDLSYQKDAVNIANQRRVEDEAKAVAKKKELNDAYTELATISHGGWYKHSAYFDQKGAELIKDVTDGLQNGNSVLDSVKNPQGYFAHKSKEARLKLESEYSNQIKADYDTKMAALQKDPDSYNEDDIVKYNQFINTPFKEIVDKGLTPPMIRKKPDQSKWYRDLQALKIDPKETEVEKNGHIVKRKSFDEKKATEALTNWITYTEEGSDMVKYHGGDFNTTLQKAMGIKKAGTPDVYSDVLSEVGKDKAKTDKKLVTVEPEATGVINAGRPNGTNYGIQTGKTWYPSKSGAENARDITITPTFTFDPQSSDVNYNPVGSFRGEVVKVHQVPVLTSDNSKGGPNQKYWNPAIDENGEPLSDVKKNPSKYKYITVAVVDVKGDPSTESEQQPVYKKDEAGEFVMKDGKKVIQPGAKSTTNTKLSNNRPIVVPYDDVKEQLENNKIILRGIDDDDQIMVQSAGGQKGYIPKKNLEAAIKRGAKVVQ